MRVDAIVNTANPRPVICLGTGSQIHEKAGPNLLKARQHIGHIDAGCAAITPAFHLHAKYVIHTVGPVWMDGNHDEQMPLRCCYENSLQLALQIAVAAFSDFLLEHEMQIYLVVFDRVSFKLSEKLFQSVASYIDQALPGIS